MLRSHLPLMMLRLLSFAVLLPSPTQASADGSVRFNGKTDPAAAQLQQATVADTDGIYRVDHLVPVGDERFLFVTETFTAESVRRRPRRAMLFLSGSAFRGNHWSIPVDGYDGPALAAERGFFAYTVDYLGVGESFRPADGLEVTLEANLEALRSLLSYIRFRRQVPKIDLVGAGYGGSLAALLAEDRGRVRSATLTAMLYDVLLGGPLTHLDFVALLESSPDGYAFFPGDASLVFTAGAPQEVRDYIAATQGGFYPTWNFLVAAGPLPFFDPSVARAPGLILFGRQDGLVGPDGVDALARDYGRDGALLVINEEAGHAPRTEGPEIAAWFWSNLFAFVDDDRKTCEPPHCDPEIPVGIEFSQGPAAPSCEPTLCDPGLPAGIEFSYSGEPGEEHVVDW